MNIFLSFPEYELGRNRQSLSATAENGLLFSDLDQLETAGFANHHMCEDSETAYDLASRLMKKMIPKLQSVDISLNNIDMLVYATCFPMNANVGEWSEFEKSRDIKHLIDYPASHLQADFGLENAFVVGIDQQACTSMLGSIRLAANFLKSEDNLKSAICLTADRFPANAKYEQSYNVISDGAAGVLVSKQEGDYKLLAAHQITNGAMAQASDDETVGHYFSYSKQLIEECVVKAGIEVSDIKHVVPQNTNIVAWRILSSVLGIPMEKVHMLTIGDVGHVISGDNMINLHHLEKQNVVQSGEKLLLLMAGFGLNWQCLIIEKV